MSFVSSLFQDRSRPLVFLAPMAGVTDWPFRKMVKKYGCDLTFSEMIYGNAIVSSTARSKVLRRLNFFEAWDGSAVQVAGCKPDLIAEAVKIAMDYGAKVVDINFGCPAKKVVNGYAGSHIMRDESLARLIVRAAFQASQSFSAFSADITVKMRLGWDQSSHNAASYCKNCRRRRRRNGYCSW